MHNAPLYKRKVNCSVRRSVGRYVAVATVLSKKVMSAVCIEWRIQKFRKRERRAEDNQCISPVVIYRKYRSSIIRVIRPLTEKILRPIGGGHRPPPLNTPLQSVCLQLTEMTTDRGISRGPTY